MFYNNIGILLDNGHNQLGTIQIDFQPFEKTIQYEDDIEVDITNRIFCDKNDLIIDEVYMRVESHTYKIMKIKTWSDYLECWLYCCECN